MSKITILGAGSWGIAIANLIHGNDYDVALWEFFEKDCEKIQMLREQPERLPGIRIPDPVLITSNMEQALENSKGLVLAVPSQFMRSTLKLAADNLPKDIKFIVSLAKGIENKTLCRMSEVTHQEFSDDFHSRVACLSGPSHAEEVSRNMPTTVARSNPVPTNSPTRRRGISRFISNSPHQHSIHRLGIPAAYS